MPTIGEQLSALRQRSGLSLETVAFKASYRGRSSVQKFFASTYNPPSLDAIVAARLARALVGAGSPPIRERDLLALTGDHTDTLPNYEFKVLDGLKRDVAVYRCAFVGTRALLRGQDPLSVYYLEQNEPVEFCWHPPGLIDSPDIYGLQILKRPLTPRYNPGELMFADGFTQAGIGDDVIIQLTNERSDASDDENDDLVLFGVFEAHLGDTMQFRVFGQEQRFKVHIDSAAAVHPLISLGKALRD